MRDSLPQYFVIIAIIARGILTGGAGCPRESEMHPLEIPKPLIPFGL
jgi:hypothetical protein